MYDLLKFCAANPSKCSPMGILANFQRNLFPVFAKLTDIKNMVSSEDFPAHVGSKIYEQVYQIFFDAGFIVRTLTGFTQNWMAKHTKDVISGNSLVFVNFTYNSFN